MMLINQQLTATAAVVQHTDRCTELLEGKKYILGNLKYVTVFGCRGLLV